MMDAESSEVVPTVYLQSGKKYRAPSAFTDVCTNYFEMLVDALWLRTESLAFHYFIEHYSTDGYFP